MPEAARILNRLNFHYTPLHASWLNPAENELSTLTRQCLTRRIDSEWMLVAALGSKTRIANRFDGVDR